MQKFETNSERRYNLKKLLAVVFAGGLGVCSNAAAAPYRYFKLLKEAESAVGAPSVFAKLETMEPDYRATFLEEKRSDLDELRTMRSLSGDAAGAAQASVWFDIANGLPKKYMGQTVDPWESVTPEDAVEAIVRAAKSRQIVILNEAHHVPFHRMFASKLARELRKEGFEFLAAEAFSLKVPLHPDTVNQDIGFYVKEPMYGEFVRTAISDGWSLIGYDIAPDVSNASDRERLREIGATANLVKTIFKKNPAAKVFIYMGYGHAKKQNVADANGWQSVTTLLKEVLNIDPLTIDQATMYSRGDVRVDNPQYRAAMQRFAPSKPIVLKAAKGGYAVRTTASGSYDMQVFHPDETMLSNEGRPLWMERQGGLRPYKVPTSMLPTNGRRLILAFRINDGPNAVPADIVMVEAGKPIPALMLPEGQFRFSYED